MFTNIAVTYEMT